MEDDHNKNKNLKTPPRGSPIKHFQRSPTRTYTITKIPIKGLLLKNAKTRNKSILIDECLERLNTFIPEYVDFYVYGASKTENKQRSKSMEVKSTQRLNYEKYTKKFREELSLAQFGIVNTVTCCLEPNKKTRDHMEDFISIKQLYNQNIAHKIYILCDGHNGEAAAKQIVESLPIIFSNNLEATKIGESYQMEEAIKISFIEMDDELRDVKEELNNSGSTTNLIFICYEHKVKVVYSGNVGDSRSVLIRKDLAYRLSYDHKANDKSEQKRVKSEGGLILKNRFYGNLAITRAHADFEMKDDVNGLSNIPHITRTPLEDTDRYLIIASDGVWDVINDKNLFILVDEYDKNKEKNQCNQNSLANVIVKRAFDLNSKDNISCIAIELKSEK